MSGFPSRESAAARGTFSAVNRLCVPGRWMRMLTDSHQPSLEKAFMAFDEAGRTKPPPSFGRVVDVL
uniref:hypothetical protein n=1 Tax=Burkholderia cepacia TaxID=292 RepID=UPI003F65286E